MKKPTLSDYVIIAWFELVLVSADHLFALAVIQMERIIHRTKNLQHGIEIAVADTLHDPEAPEDSGMFLIGINKSVTDV